MSDEFKELRARVLAQTLVIEGLVKQLGREKRLDVAELVADLDRFLNAPKSINADPLNLKYVRYELTNWQETLLYICPNA